MKLIENTKAYFGERLLKSKEAQIYRSAFACNLENAKSIGILFNATNPVSFEIVKDLVKSISSKNNEVEVLGFVDNKQLIDHYLYRKGFAFFTRNELNWFNKPESDNVEKFISEPFDILLDLSLDEPYPVKYIVALSKAKFKTGRYTINHDFHDFMIDTNKEMTTMIDLKQELDKDRKLQNVGTSDVEVIVSGKVATEIQLNFLINQLIHYLSLIKN